MGKALRRLAKRKEVRGRLNKLLDSPDHVVVVHYSCESFFDNPEGASRRVTSIAVRNLGTGMGEAFSIHQVAEAAKIAPADIEADYDSLELAMLSKFYEYVSERSSHTWVHWNMRDTNYGFPAIAHRIRVLGGKPTEIHESQLVDISRDLKTIYGGDYIGHPRLKTLIARNGINSNEFLDGEDEAAAFQRHEYVKLHQSTLRKVGAIATIVELAASGELKTDAKWWWPCQGYLVAAAEWCQEHPISTLIAFIASVLGIVECVWGVFGILSRN